MTTATKTTRRTTRRISDRRYYVQCAYRLALAAMALTAFLAANIH